MISRICNVSISARLQMRVRTWLSSHDPHLRASSELDATIGGKIEARFLKPLSREAAIQNIQ